MPEAVLCHGDALAASKALGAWYPGFLRAILMYASNKTCPVKIENKGGIGCMSLISVSGFAPAQNESGP